MKDERVTSVRGNIILKPKQTLEELYQKALDDIEYLQAVNHGLKDELVISNDIRYKQHLKIVELGVPSGAY
jgi:hypothetical protein